MINAAQSVEYPTNITLQPKNTRLPNEGSSTLTATVTDSNGNPLSGITVQFTTDKGSLSTTTGITDSNGQISTILSGVGDSSSATVTAQVNGQYGTLLYDNPSNPLQNLVAMNVLPYTLTDSSIVNFDVTANVKLSQTSTLNSGNNASYTVTAYNNGPSTATGILINESIPAWMTNVIITPSDNTSYSNGVWIIPSLSDLSSASLTINGIVGNSTTGTNITNTVNRTAQNEYNSEPSSSSSSINLPNVNLYVTNYPWYSGVYTYNYKQQIIMLAQVNNLGNTTATNIVTKYTIGNAFKVISYNLIQPGTLTFDNTTNTFTWTIPTLAGGANTPLGSYASFSVMLESLKPGSGTPDFSCNSTIISSDQNNTGTTTTKIRNLIINPAADIAINQTTNNTNPQTGNYVTITVKVDNNGPSNATGITINSLLPAGLYVGTDDPNTSYTTTQGTYNPTTGDWTIGTINNGSEVILTIIAKVTGTSGTQITNYAYKSTSDLYDWITANDANSLTFKVNGSPDSSNVNLYVTNYPWYSGVYNYNYKQQIIMLAQVNNLGNTTATNIVTKYTIGNAFKVISYNLLQPGTLTFDNTTNTFTWTIPTLAGGANTPLGSYASFSVMLESLKPGSGTPDFSCNSTIISSDQNNTGTTTTKIRNLIINPAADIAINQTTNNTNPQTGNYVTITINATNNGPNNATGITINDLLPAGLYIGTDDPNTSYTTTQGTYNPTTGDWTIGSLNNNTTATLTIIAKVNATAQTTTTNYVYKSTENEYDWITANDANETDLVST